MVSYDMCDCCVKHVKSDAQGSRRSRSIFSRKQVDNGVGLRVYRSRFPCFVFPLLGFLRPHRNVSELSALKLVMLHVVGGQTQPH